MGWLRGAGWPLVAGTGQGNLVSGCGKLNKLLFNGKIKSGSTSFILSLPWTIMPMVPFSARNIYGSVFSRNPSRKIGK